MSESFDLSSATGQLQSLRALSRGEFEPEWLDCVNVVGALDLIPVDAAVAALERCGAQRFLHMCFLPTSVGDAWYEKSGSNDVLPAVSVGVLLRALGWAATSAEADRCIGILADRVVSGRAGPLPPSLASHVVLAFTHHWNCRYPSIDASETAARWDLVEVLGPALSGSSHHRMFATKALGSNVSYEEQLARSGRLYRYPHLLSSGQLQHGLFRWHLSGERVFPPEMAEAVLQELESRQDGDCPGIVVPEEHKSSQLGRALKLCDSREQACSLLALAADAPGCEWALRLLGMYPWNVLHSLRSASHLVDAPVRFLWAVQERYGADLQMEDLLSTAARFDGTPAGEFMEVYLAMQ